MFNDKQNKQLLEALELLDKANALVQLAMGASDECYEISNAIENAAEEILYNVQANNPVEAD
jgi:hypothetical protein